MKALIILICIAVAMLGALDVVRCRDKQKRGKR